MLAKTMECYALKFQSILAQSPVYYIFAMLFCVLRKDLIYFDWHLGFLSHNLYKLNIAHFC